MSGPLTFFENFAYSACFRRNSNKLTFHTFQTGKHTFSGPSNNGLSCSKVKASILKKSILNYPEPLDY